MDIVDWKPELPEEKSVEKLKSSSLNFVSVKTELETDEIANKFSLC